MSGNVVFQHIQCQECDLVRAGEFDGQPEGPLPKLYCRRCNSDTDHEMVEIEVVA